MREQWSAPGKPWNKNATYALQTSGEPCLVPVRPFPRPSRLVHLGDVSEASGREKPHFLAQIT